MKPNLTVEALEYVWDHLDDCVTYTPEQEAALKAVVDHLQHLLWVVDDGPNESA